MEDHKGTTDTQTLLTIINHPNYKPKRTTRRLKRKAETRGSRIDQYTQNNNGDTHTCIKSESTRMTYDEDFACVTIDTTKIN